MFQRLEQMVEEVRSLQTKLVLVAGPAGCGKTHALRSLAERRSARLLNVGAALGRRLLAVSRARRPLAAFDEMSELLTEFASDDLVLVDNVELLFDRSLRFDPLDTLKRQAHSKRIAVAWPGEHRNGRLTYATVGHPEHQDYSAEGLVVLDLESKWGA